MFWEPHSSSIDFCESNYLHSKYVVELHNTVSSILGLSAFGVIGLMLNNHTQELRHTVAYAILILIGFGSAGLHGSLHWFLQSADELPMMYLMMSLIYLCAELDSPVSISKYPMLPYLMVAIATINTVIYFCFQKVYIVFIITFIAEAVAASGRLYILAYTSEWNNAKNHEKTKRICNTSVISILGAALPCWLYDMLQCDSFIHYADNYLHGMTPHVLWHFCAGFAAYCAIVALECIRLDQLQIPSKIEFWKGFFPLVTTTF